MKMKFKILPPVKYDLTEPEPEYEVDLSLEVSVFDEDVMYLKANGKVIMGFKNGMYCRYTDGHKAVKGIRFTKAGEDGFQEGRIKESHCNF